MGLKMTDCVNAFAVPGEDSLIDVVHPITGRSLVNDETLEQVRARYPGAELVTVDAWCAAKAERQHTPITWAPCTKERYWEMLEVLPPAIMLGGGFLVGEPMDSDAGNGLERYQAFREQRGSGTYEAYFEASRPLTVPEFRAEIRRLP